MYERISVILSGLESKASNLHHCSLSRPARLHGARLKAFAALGHSVPRSFSIRGYCSQLFPNTPLRQASYRRNYTTLWVHGPRMLNKSTQTEGNFLFYRCRKGQMMLEYFMTCWNILGVIQGSRRSHPPKLTPLDMNTRC